MPRGDSASGISPDPAAPTVEVAVDHASTAAPARTESKNKEGLLQRLMSIGGSGKRRAQAG